MCTMHFSLIESLFAEPQDSLHSTSFMESTLFFPLISPKPPILFQDSGNTCPPKIYLPCVSYNLPSDWKMWQKRRRSFINHAYGANKHLSSVITIVYSAIPIYMENSF